MNEMVGEGGYGMVNKEEREKGNYVYSRNYKTYYNPHRMSLGEPMDDGIGITSFDFPSKPEIKLYDQAELALMNLQLSEYIPQLQKEMKQGKWKGKEEGGGGGEDTNEGSNVELGNDGENDDDFDEYEGFDEREGEERGKERMVGFSDEEFAEERKREKKREAEDRKQMENFVGNGDVDINENSYDKDKNDDILNQNSWESPYGSDGNKFVSSSSSLSSPSLSSAFSHTFGKLNFDNLNENGINSPTIRRGSRLGIRGGVMKKSRVIYDDNNNNNDDVDENLENDPFYYQNH
jgi:hypothetical protein